MRIGLLEPGTKRSMLTFNFSLDLLMLAFEGTSKQYHPQTKHMSQPRFTQHLSQARWAWGLLHTQPPLLGPCGHPPTAQLCDPALHNPETSASSNPGHTLTE